MDSEVLSDMRDSAFKASFKHRVALTPDQIPDLVAFWDFQQVAGARLTVSGEGYVLHEENGPIDRVAVEGSPWGPYAAHIKEGQYLVCPRAECPLLDIHGPGGGMTMVAWLRRDAISVPHCEFIAGQWNETNLGRQYGLFLDISVWGQNDRISGHISNCGGPTPGYRYCMDCAIGATPIDTGQWCCIAFTYDTVQAAVWLNGQLDALPNLNPYVLAGGLHDGGPDGSDFTVGAVNRRGEMGNFFTGLMGGLAVYRRALGTAELRALADPWCKA